MPRGTSGPEVARRTPKRSGRARAANVQPNEGRRWLNREPPLPEGVLPGSRRIESLGIPSAGGDRRTELPCFLSARADPGSSPPWNPSGSPPPSEEAPRRRPTLRQRVRSGSPPFTTSGPGPRVSPTGRSPGSRLPGNDAGGPGATPPPRRDSSDQLGIQTIEQTDRFDVSLGANPESPPTGREGQSFPARGVGLDQVGLPPDVEFQLSSGPQVREIPPHCHDQAGEAPGEVEGLWVERHRSMSVPSFTLRTTGDRGPAMWGRRRRHATPTSRWLIVLMPTKNQLDVWKPTFGRRQSGVRDGSKHGKFIPRFAPGSV